MIMTCSPVCSKHLSQWLIGRDIPCLGCGIMTPNPTQHEAGTIRVLASGGPLGTLLPLGLEDVVVLHVRIVWDLI